MPSTLKFNKGGKYFSGDPGKGMLIDLAGSKIDAYDFTLKGEDSGDDFFGSYLKLSSSPEDFIDVYVYDHSGLGADYSDSYNGNNVLKISNKEYYLRSFDWFNSGELR
jgi:hypothetical protein